MTSCEVGCEGTYGQRRRQGRVPKGVGRWSNVPVRRRCAKILVPQTEARRDEFARFFVLIGPNDDSSDLLDS